MPAIPPEKTADLIAHLQLQLHVGTTAQRRDACVVTLCLQGLRLEEARSRKHQDLHDARIRVTGLKGGTTNHVPVPTWLIQELLEQQQLSRERSSDWLLTTRNGLRVDQAHLRRRWHDWRKKLDLENYRLHDLRHTAAQHAADRGASIVEVQSLLRHRKIETTAIYLQASRSLDHYYPAQGGGEACCPTERPATSPQEPKPSP